MKINTESFPAQYISLNTYLKSALPSYMIPNSIIILKFFPKNINDKIDIKELIKKIRN